MKNGIVKIWVCQKCEKEYLDRPIVCTKCDGFKFEVKYAGQISDAEELTKLIYAYKEDNYNDSIKRTIKSPAKDSGKDSGKDSAEDSAKDKRSRM